MRRGTWRSAVKRWRWNWRSTESATTAAVNANTSSACLPERPTGVRGGCQHDPQRIHLEADDEARTVYAVDPDEATVNRVLAEPDEALRSALAFTLGVRRPGV
ncbi:hypothetical protein ACWGQT_00095 [Streptomyces yangpuensis]